VQHLRDVLSGEGEEADALFAKLQDRLASMSPAERKEAAEKLGSVLGGKKPAAKKEPKAKPEPKEKKPASKQPGFAEVGATVKELKTRTGSSVAKIPDLFDALKKTHPDLSREQFDALIQKLHDEDKITLEVANSGDGENRAGEGIKTNRGLGFYVHLNEEPPAPAKRTPAAKKQGPKDGDTNAKGQVFKDGRWRKPEGSEKPKEKAPAKEKSAPVPGSPVHEPPRLPEPPKKASKPTPGTPSQSSPEEVGDALKDSMDYLKMFVGMQDGLIPLNRVYHELVKRVPDLTKEQFHNLVWQLGQDRKAEFHVLNEVNTASSDAKDYAIGKNDRMYNYFRLKPEAVKSGKDLVPSKPAAADKEHKSWSEAYPDAPAPTPGSPVHEPPRLPEPPKPQDQPGTPAAPVSPPPVKKAVVNAGGAPTDKQINFAMSLLNRKGYGSRFMNSSFKALGASMRQRSGSVADWLKGMNRQEISDLIDRLND
jgi:hypothetical protein